MKRRSFLGGLFSSVAAPFAVGAATAIAESLPEKPSFVVQKRAYPTPDYHEQWISSMTLRDPNYKCGWD